MLRYNNKNRSIFLTGEIRSSTITALVSKLLSWDNKSNKPIELYINSEGGEVQAGFFAVYDVIQALSCPLKTFCLGQAFSSAAFLVASGSPGNRFIFPNATMMLHPPSMEISGTFKEISLDLKIFQELDSRIWETLAKHLKKDSAQISQDCQQDKYFSAKEALEYGLVDSIVTSYKKR